jgi:hypothetical protein
MSPREVRRSLVVTARNDLLGTKRTALYSKDISIRPFVRPSSSRVLLHGYIRESVEFPLYSCTVLST